MRSVLLLVVAFALVVGCTEAPIPVPPDPVPPNREESPAGLFMVSETEGWALASKDRQSILYRTDGQTLTEAAILEIDCMGADLFFSDLDHGWLLCHQGVALGSEQVTLLTTSDGAKSWHLAARTENQPGGGTIRFGGMKTGIAFRDPQVGWLTFEDRGPGGAALYRSRDGGVTWDLQALPIPADHREHLLTIRPPYFFSPTNGVLPVTYVPDYETMLYTTADGGETWVARPEAARGLSGSSGMAFAIYGASHGWAAVGESLYASTDGGATWEAIGTAPGGVRRLQFVSPTAGFALTWEGIFRTEDGGRSWK